MSRTAFQAFESVSIAIERDRRLRRVRSLRAVGNAMTFLASCLLAAALFDRWSPLSAPARTVLLGVAVLASLAWVVVHLVRRLRGTDPVSAAAEIEAAARLEPGSVQTLASELRDPAPGVSPSLLQELDRRACHALAHASLPPLPRAATPLVRGGLVVAATIALAGLPGLDMSTPLLRTVMPWQARDPAYANALSVQPGDVTLLQGSPLTVVAIAPGSIGAVYIETAGLPAPDTDAEPEAWSRSEMSPRGADAFVARLPGVDRELRYRVVTGDLRSATFSARVRTLPAVRSLRFDVTEPTDTGGRRRSITADGPELSFRPGSDLSLELTATEPLREVTADLADFSGPDAPEPGNTFWQRAMSTDVTTPTRASVALPAWREGVVERRLTLTLRAVAGGESSARLTLLAAPNAPPTVRITRPPDGQPAGPRDDLDIAVSASDDTALASLTLEISTPSGVVRRSLTLPAPAGPGPELAVSTRLSMAGLPLAVGDTVTLQAVARDSAGAETTSDPVRVLVSSAAVDPQSPQRIEALGLAARAAVDALVALDGDAATAIAPLAPPDRSDLAAASEHLVQLGRGLGRATRYSPSPRFSDAMGAMADSLVPLTARIEAVLSAPDDPDSPSSPADDSQKPASSAANSLVPVVNTAPLRRVSAALDRLYRAEAAGLLAANPRVRIDVPEDLRSMPAEALRELHAQEGPELSRWPAPDFVTAIRLGAIDGLRLSQRLDTAWRFEALRPDMLPRRVADLALAARAAEAFYLSGAPGLPPPFVGALESLRTEHESLRSAGTERDVPSAADAHSPAGPGPDGSAKWARQALRTWAGPVGSTAEALERLAIDWSDRRPPGLSPDAPESRRVTELRYMAARHAEIARSISADPDDPPEVAGQMPPPEVAGQLAALLGRLAAVTPAAASSPAATRIAERADQRQAAFVASIDLDLRLQALTLAVQRAVNPEAAAGADLDTEARALATGPLSAGAIEALRDELRRFAPELGPAAQTVNRLLRPAALAFARALPDRPATASAATDVLDAIRAARRDLASARATLQNRDALATARAAITATHAALTARTDAAVPDARELTFRFAVASAALDRAVLQALRPHADRLLARLPEMSGYFPPYPSRTARVATSLPSAASASTKPADPVALDSSPPAAPPPTAARDLRGVPVQFHPAVRAYFERLSPPTTTPEGPP